MVIFNFNVFFFIFMLFEEEGLERMTRTLSVKILYEKWYVELYLTVVLTRESDGKKVNVLLPIQSKSLLLFLDIYIL